MGTLYFILILLLVLSIYAYCSIKGREVVRGVEAGPIDSCDVDLINKRSFVSSPLRVCDKNGEVVNTNGMLRVVVCGNCMAPKGITDKMQLLVKKVDTKSLDTTLKNGDIVMIHLRDKKLDKIRVFDHFDNNGRLVTYRFDNSGNKIFSSRPHYRESVVGIAKYKI